MDFIYKQLLDSARAIPPQQVVPTLTVAFANDETVCGFYRCVKPAVELQKAGLINPIFLDELDGLEHAAAIATSDILLIERPWDEVWKHLLPQIKFGGVGVICETDDWIDGVKDAELGRVNNDWTQDRVDIYHTTLQLADCIIVSTENMRRAYEKKLNVKTFTAMNYVDLDPRWDVILSNDPNRIVMFSGPTHVADMAVLKRPLEVVLTQRPEATLQFIGTIPPWIFKLSEQFGDRIIFEHKWYDVFEYPQVLANTGEILLIPLVSNDFNSIGKSDVKYLEGTMTGKTCIASPVGIYKDTIKQGKNGFLAKTEDDWIEKILLLLDKPRLRKKMHQEALDYVVTERTYHHNLDKWYNALVWTYNKSIPRKITALEVARAGNRT